MFAESAETTARAHCQRDLEVTPLGATAALVLGEWQVERDSGKLGGNFTLVFRYLDGRWLIVDDHTSSNSPA